LETKETGEGETEEALSAAIWIWGLGGCGYWLWLLQVCGSGSKIKE